MLKKMKHVSMAVIFASAVILLNGCETTKGVAVGIAATADGVAKDTTNLWHNMAKADDWMKKNLW